MKSHSQESHDPPQLASQPICRGTSVKTSRARRALRRFLPVMLMVAAVDQATKALMLEWLTPGVPQPVIGEWFRFRLAFNPGAAFSLGTDHTWVFTCIQIAFVVGSLWYAPRLKDRWQIVGLGCIAGGALGNLIDRLFRAPEFFIGHVVDFISVGRFAIFNIADAAINVGVAILVVAIFTEERRAFAAHQASEGGSQ